MYGPLSSTTQEEDLTQPYHIPVPKQTELPISYNVAAEPGVIDHSHLMLRFEHARSTQYGEGLIPYCLLGERPKDRLPEHQRPSRDR